MKTNDFPPRVPHLLLGMLCTLPPLTTSALDANANGVSDVWEALHPAAASAPAGDNDGDGVTNRREGACWTDPDDAGSALRTEGFQRSGNLSGFTFQERDWMRDSVLASSDLVEWTVLDPPRQGQTGDREVSIEDSAPRGFYQIARHDALNSDTDALTNLEEQKLGTDPLLWDTDGDKVADDVEFLIGTNPLLAGDNDGDNLPDDWEEWIIRSDDGDDVTDKTDVTAATDFDGDGVTDGDEFALGTSPVRALRNVLLFLTEDQGADLGCMGTVGLETPAVDALAQSGVMFERAFCLSPVCSPSKMAMFTGTYPHTTSAYRNVPNHGNSFPLSGDPSNLSLGGVHEDMPTLIEILRDRGFFTAVSHKTHVQPVRKWPYHKGYGQPTTAALATSYINDLVTSAGDRPFYMTFGIGAPHLPFRGILQNQGKWSATGGLTGDGHATNVDANAIVVPNCYPDEPGVRQDIADYYGAIECVDEVFGAVMAALQANGVLDETLVIYTSDHGIGLHRSKQSIYATGTRVPFIVAGAGIAGNVTIDAPVSHLDVVPTLLDYLGIPLFPNMPGKSLAPVLSGNSDIVSGRETILASAHEKYDGRAVCDGRYYYIRNIRKIAGA
ncbi:MAG: sulfatase-like hydrolase/transferase, partial [Verrucomicrobiae bacterium]|nr:sulfatase-like hydrolase/transferase [Verrucomicrobiae bacterium]